MKRHREESAHIIAALELIDSVRGKPLTTTQRQKLAVELSREMLSEALLVETARERRRQEELARMMRDPKGKAFTMAMTDQGFRSARPSRVANQLVYLLKVFGIPEFLSPLKRLELSTFSLVGESLAPVLVPMVKGVIRKEASTVILPGEGRALLKHTEKRREEGVRINLNHLGEAILGEAEAKRRLEVYLKDLEQPYVEYVSIKISTIFSQINLLAWDHTLEELAGRLKLLYRAAKTHLFTRADGSKTQKFVNLDMEEYRDLHLTVELFRKVLSEPEFHDFSAGIVLQAYLPDAHAIQKELTTWAMERVKGKGAPIKIRIVKGANLAMEQVEASLRGWPQAPLPSKVDVDANYKKMVTYGSIPAHAKAVHLGIASHNLFDIAYAMLLRSENEIEREVSFEMLEGMADPMRRTLQKLTKDVLLYCPVATKRDFQSAIAYLIRRLDENTGADNFLRHTFGLQPGTREWDDQVHRFTESCEEISRLVLGPRRTQDRSRPPEVRTLAMPFENEPDTDFALLQNRLWVQGVVAAWKEREIGPIPCVIGGKEVATQEKETRGRATYSLADWSLVDRALNLAQQTQESWRRISARDKGELLMAAAHKLRERRGDLIGCMMADGGKTPLESDPEISEAIDFAEYYARSRLKMDECHDLSWRGKGTVLVTPPWNFPISIPAGGIFAALAADNCVLFKPAPEAVLSGWWLATLLWEAGIPKEVLQFFSCVDDPVGSRLIADPRVNQVVLTGATSTARLFLKLRPGLDLVAETGGKNGMIITGMSDRDLAIKDLVQSAFGHSGQKCSAASLGILETEVYDDPHFLRQLKEAAESLPVGPAWDLTSKVVPLIRDPTPDLLRGLTTLDEGEEWLLKPRQDPNLSNLWSPGIKLGVREGSFMHQTELFGPVLGLMRAKNLDHALHLVNGTPYGLTSGLQSLDEREQKRWVQGVEAGNLYINRGITGAIVRRQPFGGCKGSGFGPGAKAGGPNYVMQFAHPEEMSLPQEKAPVPSLVENLTLLVRKHRFSAEMLGTWYASISSYAFWVRKFHHRHDPSRLLGQDNFFMYRPLSGMALRISKDDRPLDVLRSLAAALTCETPLFVSWSHETTPLEVTDAWRHLMPFFHIQEEGEAAFLERVRRGTFRRVRLLSPTKEAMVLAASRGFTHLATAPVLATGRFELLHYLREVALSVDYHRYGNVGVREGESRMMGPAGVAPLRDGR
jgi:RHH-type proline utilization regulon transcriptional repressor/proline dehydrogenase/delta 1-pyrroline-5-carboxylate dehydrogenase